MARKKTDVNVDVTARNKTQRAFDQVNKGLGGMAAKFKGLKTVAVAAFAAIAVAITARFITSTTRAGDELLKLSQRLGTTTEALSQYQHVAELSGVQINTLTMGWQRMTRRVAEAAQGTGEAKDALLEMGLNAEALNRLAPDKQFEFIAEAMGEVANQSDKVRLAMKLFDSEGVALLQTMEGGAAGLRAMRQDASDLGATLTEAESKAFADFNESLTRMGSVLSGVANAIVAFVVPAFTFLFNAIADGVKWLRDFIGLNENVSGVIEEEWSAAANSVFQATQKMSAGAKKAAAATAALAKRQRAGIDAIKLEVAQRKDLLESYNQGSEAVANMNVILDITNKGFAIGIRDGDELADTFAAIAVESHLLGKQLDEADDRLKTLRDTGMEMGRTISNAFGSIVKGSSSVKDALKNVLASLIEIAFQKAILGPIGDIIGSGLSGLFEGFSFAKGGVMSGAGPVKSYATGGVANTPQVAVFGEGSQNEAFVPLPDGKSIPVTMGGGGGGGATIINIDARGAEVGVEEKIREVLATEEPRIISIAVKQSISQVQALAGAGGSFSKAVGRR